MRPTLLLATLWPLSLSYASMDPVILGCYPSWASESAPVSSLPYPSLTQISHCFLLADEKGNVRGEGAMPDPALIRAAHEKHCRVSLGLGGWGSASYYGPMSKDPQAVENHVRQVLDLVEREGYDGVDLDWEFPEDEAQGRVFTAFLTTFRERLDKIAARTGKTYTVSAAVNPGSWAGKWLDGKALSKAVDFLMVMTYDFTGPWDDWAGHHSPLFASPKDPRSATANVRSGMEFWNKKKGLPKDKLLIGIPLYARGFKVPRPFEPTTKGQNTDISSLAYRDLAALREKGWTSQRDEESRVPWLYSPQKDAVIGYDDPDSVSEKAAWARKQGFRGILFWSLDQDLIPQGGHPLVEAAAKAFR